MYFSSVYCIHRLLHGKIMAVQLLFFFWLCSSLTPTGDNNIHLKNPISSSADPHPDTQSPLPPPPPPIRAPSPRLGTNISGHVLSVKNRCQREDLSSVSPPPPEGEWSHSQMRYVTWATQVSMYPVCRGAPGLMGNEGERPFVPASK